MIPIADGHFVVATEALGDDALRAYAIGIFEDLDILTSSTLPFSDYGLSVRLEEGSVKGATAVTVTLGALYAGIIGFGGFMQGLREIQSLGKYVMEEVAIRSPERLNLPKRALKAKRTNAGVLTKLNSLFERVARGELEPDEATARAYRLFEGEHEIPEGLAVDISKAMKTMKKHPQQMKLLPDLSAEDIPIHTPTSPDRQRTPAIPAESRKLRVEVRREYKNGKTTVQLIEL